MIKLFIDNLPADIDSSTPIVISICVASLTKIEDSKNCYSRSFAIPMTARNMRLMGDVDQINCVAMFNQNPHSARIVADGCTVLDGALRLESIECDCGAVGCGSGRYVCSIVDEGKLWVRQAAESMFKDVTMSYSQEISEYSITQSWLGEKNVRFLPVQRDKFAVNNSNNNLFPPSKVLSFEDYHPFLSVRAVLETIMLRAGYKIKSEFMDSSYFRSLYISGNYPTRDVSLIRGRMNFLAGRFACSSAAADKYGRVYADPNAPFNTVGNIVDTADGQQTQNSVTIEGVFNTNNAFRRVGNRVAFVPVQEVSVGFEYFIKYSSDYYMLSRVELKCFNYIFMGTYQRAFKVVNRNADRRATLALNKEYMCIVFDHVPGAYYKLKYTVLINPNADPKHPEPADTTVLVHSVFSSRTKQIVFKSQYPILSAELFVGNSSTQNAPYAEDWALYDGYVKERGTVEVEAVVRSSPERVTPGSPKYFDRLYFGGAESGMNITLSNQITVRPIFLPHPSDGSTVDFEQVAAHEVRQIEFIESIRQLFDLYFLTDNFERVVYIEPGMGFYKNDVVVDWSTKIDYNHTVTTMELGADLARRVVLRYRDGDGAVARWNQDVHENMGEWGATVDNLFAKNGTKFHTNPMFTPSRNLAGEFPDAINASLVQVGNRNWQKSERSEGLNFLPKIVHYLGMVPLPEGQRWGWPGYGTSYPFVTFHHQGLRMPPYSGPSPDPASITSLTGPLNVEQILENGISLCFEDRDNVAGIHRYHDDRIETYNKSKRVTLYMNLRPEDIEPFIVPNAHCRDLRALFRLKVNGEYALFRLEEICDYNPSSNDATKCIFIKELF